MLGSTSGMLRPDANQKLKSHAFIGVSLSGGKNDKTCIALLEYFPDHDKVFLSRLYEKISNSKYNSPDEALVKLMESMAKKIDYVALDVPISLPRCVSCRLNCPGVAKCKVSEVQWMRKQYGKRGAAKKRPNKLFTPYTQRAIEMFVEDEMGETFNPSHALGANVAPLAARALFLQRRMKKQKFVEVYPPLSVWRIGSSIRISKSHLRNYKKSVGGEVSREVILKSLVEKNLAFVYQQDIKAMIAKPGPFEAFVCGYTAFLKHAGLTQKRRKDFPRSAAWLEFPIEGISW